MLFSNFVKKINPFLITAKFSSIELEQLKTQLLPETLAPSALNNSFTRLNKLYSLFIAYPNHCAQLLRQHHFNLLSIPTFKFHNPYPATVLSEDQPVALEDFTKIRNFLDAHIEQATISEQQKNQSKAFRSLMRNFKIKLLEEFDPTTLQDLKEAFMQHKHINQILTTKALDPITNKFNNMALMDMVTKTLAAPEYQDRIRSNPNKFFDDVESGFRGTDPANITKNIDSRVFCRKIAAILTQVTKHRKPQAEAFRDLMLKYKIKLLNEFDPATLKGLKLAFETNAQLNQLLNTKVLKLNSPINKYFNMALIDMVIKTISTPSYLDRIRSNPNDIFDDIDNCFKGADYADITKELQSQAFCKKIQSILAEVSQSAANRLFFSPRAANREEFATYTVDHNLACHSQDNTEAAAKRERALRSIHL